MRTPATLVLTVATATGCLATSCASTPPSSRTTSTAAVSRTPFDPAGQERRDVDVIVALRAPGRSGLEATDADAPAPDRPGLEIVLTNRSAQPADVTDVRVHLAPAREGAFRCADEVGAASTAREPTTLAPGASFAFERALDCALPLVGGHAVRVVVSFGRRQAETARQARAFSLSVAALPKVVAREAEGVGELWAAMGASAALSARGERKESRALFAILNAGTTPVEVPSMRLALRTYRAGSPIACEEAPVVLRTPTILGTLEAHHEPVELPCLRQSAPGAYEISAWLVISRGAEGDREIALGRVHVDVTGDAADTGPRPWR